MWRKIVLVLLLSLIATAGWSQNSPSYKIKAELNPQEHRLKADLEMKVHKSSLKKNTLGLLFSSSAEITKLKANGLQDTSSQSTNPAIDRYQLSFSPNQDSTIDIKMEYELVIPDTHRVNRINEDWIELNIDSFWHPVLASLPSISYELTLDMNGDYELVSGDQVRQINSQKYWVSNSIPRQDIALTASPHWYKREGQWVDIYSSVKEVSLDSLSAKANNSLRFLKRFINKPEDFQAKRVVVVSPRKDVGYARKNYIALSDVSNDKDRTLGNYLTHEFSHYWFSNADAFSRHHWLNESFAEYVSMLYLLENKGESAYQQNLKEKKEVAQKEERSIANFKRRPSYLAMYKKGPIVLHHFRESIGSDAFQDLVNKMIDKQISTTEQLYQLVADNYGEEKKNQLKRLLNKV